MHTRRAGAGRSSPATAAPTGESSASRRSGSGGSSSPRTRRAGGRPCGTCWCSGRGRAEGGVADDRGRAALHRAVERLGDDPGADARQLAAVQLGLAEDVEPERRPGDEASRSVCVRALRARRRAGAVADLRVREGLTFTPLLFRNVAICWPVASVHHVRPRQVAEGEVVRSGPGGGPAAADRSRRQVASGFDELRVDPHRPVELGCRARRRSSRPASAEVVEPAEVGDPDARQLVVAAEVAARRRRSRTAGRACPAVVEVHVPVVGRADHAVAEAVGGDRELDRHRRDAAVGGTPTSNALRPFLKTSLTTAGCADPGQEVGADHPLVVLGDDLSAPAELLTAAGVAAGSVSTDAVVEADERAGASARRPGSRRFAGRGSGLAGAAWRPAARAGRSPSWPRSRVGSAGLQVEPSAS